MVRLRLKELAEERGLNISQTARRSGLDIQLVRRYWRNDIRNVSLDAIEVLARLLGVVPGDLFAAEELPEGEPVTEGFKLPVLGSAVPYRVLPGRVHN